MNKLHRQIIGISWLVLGALIFSLLVFKLDSASSATVIGGVLAGLLFIAGGFVLLANLRKLSWVCHPCALLSLLTFPVGTVIGIYYLWYFFRSMQMARSDSEEK
ncbi:MAG: hypothetical protein FD121_521 [Gallionellaceae bacterium]|nr:MAG: hypothetical protein FD121_521 [Gallionellaceae bacterium]